jgi:hypothetical protein
MGQPSAASLHPINVLLTQFGIDFRLNNDRFIFDKVFPVVHVDKPSNKYPVFTAADWLRDQAKPRTGAAQSAGGGYSISTDSYQCEVLAFHKDIDYQTRATADAAFGDQDENAARFVTSVLLQGQERKWVTDNFATGIWGTTSTPTNLWSDPLASNPGADVDTARITIEEATGYTPNTLVLGPRTYLALRRHPLVETRFGLPLGSSQSIGEAQLAAYFDVERVLVARSISNSAAEGATASLGFNYGKHALLCYVAPNAGLGVATAGVTFAWDGLEGAGYGKEIGITKYDMRPTGIKVDRIEGEVAFDNKVTAAALGYFFLDAVA